MSHDKTSNRIKMRVMGISYNKIHNDAYALILAQENGPYRIPVIIGSAEAQAIAIKMENIIPPRPLTHDLFVSFTHAFGVTLRDVFIYKFESGIFYSELTFSDGDREVVLDSRTSDAISIAIRTDTPIYTTTDILTEAGFKTTKKYKERHLKMMISDMNPTDLSPNWRISQLRNLKNALRV